MKSYATLFAGTLVTLAIPNLSRADFSYTGEFIVADFRTRANNQTVYDINHQSTVLGDQDVQAPGDYTGTYRDPLNNQEWTYNSHGLARLQTALGANSIHTAFMFDAYAGLVSGQQGFQVQTMADGTPSIEFTATQDGTYILSAGGQITAADNQNSGCSFTLTGMFEDETTNTQVQFSIANSSQSLASFTQQVSVIDGHIYQLHWDGNATDLSPATGSPASSESAMSGFVDLAPVPEPASVAGLSLGALLVLRRRKNRQGR